MSGCISFRREKFKTNPLLSIHSDYFCRYGFSIKYLLFYWWASTLRKCQHVY